MPKFYRFGNWVDGSNKGDILYFEKIERKVSGETRYK